MSERRSTTEGDIQARRLREYVTAAIEAKTGIKHPANQSLDQLVRHAAKCGIELFMHKRGER